MFQSSKLLHRLPGCIFGVMTDTGWVADTEISVECFRYLTIFVELDKFPAMEEPTPHHPLTASFLAKYLTQHNNF